MKNLILSYILGLAPAIASAGGHADFAGHGTGVTTDTKTIEATTGTHVQQTSSDVWIYDNPPEGFHAAMIANCNYFSAFAVGMPQPVGGVGICQASDPDGDISLWNGAFQIDGTILMSVVAGTGKWAALTGAKFQGKTRQSLGDANVYDFAPVN